MSLSALGYLNADFNTVTVSGHSAGCQWSETMQLVYSGTIRGAALMQCGPYGTDLPDFHAAGASTASLRATANSAAAAEISKIDPTSNLALRAAYIIKGTNDTTVAPFVVDATYWFLKDQGMTTINLEERNIGH